MGIVTIEGILLATVMILGRNIWGYCYSKEEKVVRYVGQILVITALSHILDGIQSVLSGKCQNSEFHTTTSCVKHKIHKMPQNL